MGSLPRKLTSGAEEGITKNSIYLSNSIHIICKILLYIFEQNSLPLSYCTF